MAQKNYFTADLHFGHIANLKYQPWRKSVADIDDLLMQTDCNAAIKLHDEWLINLWNKTIAKNDNIYILGDFCLRNKEYTENILRQLHGNKFMILGNHDKSIKGLERYFKWVGDIKEAKFTNNQFKFIDPNETFCVEMCHYPMLTWNRRPHGTVMIHGHCHNSISEFNIQSKELRVDVGIDSDLSEGNFIELEKLYNYFVDIRNSAGCSTFQEYNKWKMNNDGFRM